MITVRQDKVEKRYALHKLAKFATKNPDRGYVNGLEVDSRKILPGNAFVAIKGLRKNGLNYIEDAVARGASAVLAEPSPNNLISTKIPFIEIPNLKEQLGAIAATFYDHPSKNMHIVGVTGTNGKTTTAGLIGQLASITKRPSGVIGTLGSFPKNDLKVRVNNTTPDAITIQSTLADWRDLNIELVALEVSSHALEQGRVDGTEIDTGVFTNLSPDHLDFHVSMEKYGQAKKKLFSNKGLKNAVVNFEDKFSEELVRDLSSDIPCLKFSIHPKKEADIKVLKYSEKDLGICGVIDTPWGVSDFQSPLPGKSNLENLLAALASSVLSGGEFEDIVNAIPLLRPIPGRFQFLQNDYGFKVVIDYAHSPKALEQAILSLRPYFEGSLTIVFGCGGNRDKSKRSEMGRVACEASDQVIITSDNPRDESPEQILDQIQLGCFKEINRISDRAEAIVFAINQAKIGDCVLIAGKGHEEVQIFDDAEVRFSDFECAREALDLRSSQ